MFGDAPWFQKKQVVLPKKVYGKGDQFVVDLKDRKKAFFRIEMWERKGDLYDQIFNSPSGRIN